MATVKSFSFSDKNTEIAEWVNKQKSLSQSLEIAIKLAISKYGICDLTQKRDEMFVSGEKIEAPADPKVGSELAEDKVEKHADKPEKVKKQAEQPEKVMTEQMQSSVKTDVKNNGIDLSILDLK